MDDNRNMGEEVRKNVRGRASFSGAMRITSDPPHTHTHTSVPKLLYPQQGGNCGHRLRSQVAWLHWAPSPLIPWTAVGVVDGFPVCSREGLGAAAD